MKPLTLYRLQIQIDGPYADYVSYYEDLLGVKNFSHCGVLCLGEITNMPGHYVIVGKNGKVVYGLHSDIFVELSEDET